MASGPKILAVAAGDALSVTPINSNFTSIQDFLSAIPIDNLEKYYTSNVFMGMSCRNSEPFGNGETVYGPYFMPEQGGSEASRLKSIQAQLEASARLQSGDSIVITLEEQTSAGSPGSWAAVSGASITINDSTAYADSENANDFLYWANDAASAGTELDPTAQHWFKLVITTGGSRTITSLQAAAVMRTKLQTG